MRQSTAFTQNTRLTAPSEPSYRREDAWHDRQTGPESTVEYYQRLIRGYRARHPEGRPSSLDMNSVDNKKSIDWFTANELVQMDDYLSVEIERPARAGSDFGLIAANTPHLVLDRFGSQRHHGMTLRSLTNLPVRS